MASWITQTFELKDPCTKIVIDDMGVQIFYQKDGNDDTVYFDPTNRDEANQMAFVLRLASKRLEDIGKTLP